MEDSGQHNCIFLAGYVYIRSAPPIYSGNVFIQAENKSAGRPGLPEMAGIFSTDKSSTAEMEILRSRSIIGHTVDKLKLNILVRPRFFPMIGEFFYRKHTGTAYLYPEEVVVESLRGLRTSYKTYKY